MINSIGNNEMHRDLISFLKENEIRGTRLRLFLFWARHPHAKFNLDGIAHMLDLSRHTLREILHELINDGMVNEQYLSNGIAHYSLNHDHASIPYINHVSELDWSVIKSIEGELEKQLVLA